MALRYQLFYQISRITKDKGALAQDDRLDALSIAVAHWTEQMGRDVDTAIEDAKAERMDNELRTFMDSVFGRKPKEKTWLSEFTSLN